MCWVLFGGFVDVDCDVLLLVCVECKLCDKIGVVVFYLE